MLTSKQINKINNSIINNLESISELEDSLDLWTYLTKNNVANYYINNLETKTSFAERIVIKTSDYREKFHKTLRILNEFKGAEFALFKTVRKYGEVVDGDIDIVVRKNDYNVLLKSLNAAGFDCFEDGEFKAICTKEGFLKIEPRVVITSYDRTLVEEETIWKNVEKIKIEEMEFLKTTDELDLCALLLNSIYGPKYLRLYEYKLFSELDLKRVEEIIEEKTVRKDLSKVINKLKLINISEIKFPYFYDNTFYLQMFSGSIAKCSKYSFQTKVRQFVFFFYMKYKYIITNKLHFEHSWL